AASQVDDFHAVDAVRAKEGHVFQPCVCTLLNQACRFSREAAEVDQFRVCLGNIVQQPTEVGIANRNRIRRHHFTTQRREVLGNHRHQTFAVGAAVVNGGNAANTQHVVDVVSS